jgi:flagellar motor switch protein FliM
VSNSVSNSSGRQKIQRLLASIGSRPQKEAAQIDAVEYDWRQPHYFSSEQLKRLDGFTAKVAQACLNRFNELYHSDFKVAVISTTQHFAGELAVSGNIRSDYCLAFGADENQIFGYVGIPAKTAIIWTTQLLGDNKSEEDYNRDLSQLEKSLLLDIAAGVIDAFSDSYENQNLRTTAKLIKGQLPVKLRGDEELCKITFRVEKSGTGNASEVYFLIFCDKLKKVTEQNVQAGANTSAKDIAKTMLSHVGKVPVTITAKLASTEITFEEITNLNVDDILVLDKKLSMPVDLIIGGRTLFRGWLAKSDGRQAVVITESCSKNKT